MKRSRWIHERAQCHELRKELEDFEREACAADREVGYVVLTAQGVGRYKVRALPERLREFRRKIALAPGQLRLLARAQWGARCAGLTFPNMEGDTMEADYVVEIAGEHGNDDPCQCSGCAWRGPAQELEDIESCSLTPGDASPAGRCPECNSLAYLDRPKDRARDAAPAMLAALQGLFAHCAMVHKHWGEGCNQREADAAIAQARAAIAEAVRS